MVSERVPLTKQTPLHAESPVRQRQSEEIASVKTQPSQAEIRLAQEQLRLTGFSPGPVDGVLGQKTSTALRQYQDKYSLPITGILDDVTKTLLEFQAKKHRLAEQEQLTEKRQLAKEEQLTEKKTGGQSKT